MAKPPQRPLAPASSGAQERRLRRRAHQELLQQYDRLDRRPEGNVLAWRRRQRGLQGSRKSTPSPPSWPPKPVPPCDGARRAQGRRFGAWPGLGERPPSAPSRRRIEVVGIKDVTPSPQRLPPKKRRRSRSRKRRTEHGSIHRPSVGSADESGQTVLERRALLLAQVPVSEA